MKDIGIDVSHELLAIPLYEIYVDGIYNNDKCTIKENDVVFDIGANIGLFTYNAIYRNCKKCYSFEPNRQLYEKIKSKNIENLNIYNVAVSDKDEVENFFISRGGISSCLEKDNNQIIKDGDIYRRDNDIFDKIEVNTISIMNFIKNNNIDRIDFFKCDCEGSEYEIIDNLEEEFLKNNIDRCLIEYHYLHNPVFKEKYHKMLNKLIKCNFDYHNNSDDNVVNDGVLFLWKKQNNNF